MESCNSYLSEDAVLMAVLYRVAQEMIRVQDIQAGPPMVTVFLTFGFLLAALWGRRDRR